MDVPLRVSAGGKAPNRVMNLRSRRARPEWLCLFAKDPHRGNVGCKDAKILRASGANALPVQSDFHGDHSFGERKAQAQPLAALSAPATTALYRLMLMLLAGAAAFACTVLLN